ncbi:MAG: hypothetical protein KY476_02295 [Planctomycetes bacterium]|nr:hypothetical protein [Planctomycetota bacterium]
MHRVILLGASNLTVAFPLVVRLIAARLAGPVSLFGAMGHGRSYGEWSRLVFRGLPGIVPCRLWDDLAAARQSSPDIPEVSLITDVGNDILYGYPVERIIGWVEVCAEKLLAGGGQLVFSLPPLESIRGLSRARYLLMRSLFFPRNRMPLQKVLGLAEELQSRLRKLAERLDTPFLEPPGEWYGFDPIHIVRRKRPAAWSAILSQWQAFQGSENAADDEPTVRSGFSSHRLRWARPAERTLFGFLQRRRQPVLSNDELTVWLY